MAKMVFKLIILLTSCFLMVYANPLVAVDVQKYLDTVMKSIEDLNNKNYVLSSEVELELNGKLYEGKFDVIKKDKYISSKFTIKANDLSQEFLQINLNRFIFSVDKEKNCLLIKKELDNRHASYIREMRDTKDIIAKTRVVTLKSYKRRINNVEFLPFQLNENITFWVTVEPTSIFAVQQIDFKSDQSMGSFHNVRFNTIETIPNEHKQRFEFSVDDCESFEYIQDGDIPKTVQKELVIFLIKNYDQLVPHPIENKEN